MNSKWPIIAYIEALWPKLRGEQWGGDQERLAQWVRLSLGILFGTIERLQSFCRLVQSAHDRRLAYLGTILNEYKRNSKTSFEKTRLHVPAAPGERLQAVALNQ